MYLEIQRSPTPPPPPKKKKKKKTILQLKQAKWSHIKAKSSHIFSHFWFLEPLIKCSEDETLLCVTWQNTPPFVEYFAGYLTVRAGVFSTLSRPLESKVDPGNEVVFVIHCCHLILILPVRHWHWRMFSFLSSDFVVFHVCFHVWTKVVNRIGLYLGPLPIPLAVHTLLFFSVFRMHFVPSAVCL